jgi:hypothetical protein
MGYNLYKSIIKILREKLPPAYPVYVRRVKLNGLDGDCMLHNKKFTIRINREMSEGAAIDCLIHEWAHARAWNHLHDSLDHHEFELRSHDASWGVAYSEVYRTYEQYFLFKKDCK